LGIKRKTRTIHDRIKGRCHRDWVVALSESPTEGQWTSIPSGTIIKTDNTNSAGCMAHLLLASGNTPTATAIAAVMTHTWAVATCPRAIDIICRFNTCAIGVPETSDMTKGASNKAMSATPKAAQAPVR